MFCSQVARFAYFRLSRLALVPRLTHQFAKMHAISNIYPLIKQSPTLKRRNIRWFTTADVLTPPGSTKVRDGRHAADNLQLSCYISRSTDPWLNLAMEEWLFRRMAPDEYVLYLWRNAECVVIGRNQVCVATRRIDVLESVEGGEYGAGGHGPRSLDSTSKWRRDSLSRTFVLVGFGWKLTE